MFHKTRHKIGNNFIDVRRSASKGQAILFIHGIGVSSNYFIPLAERMANHYEVHLLDMPGYGTTPKPQHPLSPTEQAQVAIAYMKKLGLKDAAIIGQSMGCQTAAHVAAQYPEGCAKLILIGPTVNKWERTLLSQAGRLLIDTFRESTKMNAIVLHDYFHMGLPAYLITSRAMIEDHIEDTLRRVTIPTCIIRGSRDGIAPEKWIRYLATITENSTEVHSVKGAPHNVQFSNDREVYELCDHFLKQ
ncbi:MAG TPA: alpha/beta hydrolase [Candidatus Saccharimonadales bacterium]|nr:alpha/beta hydrolase [Candidatus Saccharimonadales bacterium]